MEVIIFAALAFFLLWKFGDTPMADDPIELHNPQHEAPGGYKAMAAAIGAIMCIMALMAMTGGGEFDTNTYANVRAAGGDDAVAMAGGLAAIGSLALLAMASGVLLKLSLGLFVAAVVGSVMYIAMITGGL